MIETQFEDVTAFKIETWDYLAACAHAKGLYGRGFRSILISEDCLFFVAVLPANTDGIEIHTFDDSLASMLWTLEFLRDWR